MYYSFRLKADIKVKYQNAVNVFYTCYAEILKNCSLYSDNVIGKIQKKPLYNLKTWAEFVGIAL